MHLWIQLHGHAFIHFIQRFSWQMRWYVGTFLIISKTAYLSFCQLITAGGERTPPISACLRPPKNLFCFKTLICRPIVCTPIPDLIPLILSVFKNINLGSVDCTVSGWWAQTVRLTSLSTSSSNNTFTTGARSLMWSQWTLFKWYLERNLYDFSWRPVFMEKEAEHLGVLPWC